MKHHGICLDPVRFGPVAGLLALALAVLTPGPARGIVLQNDDRTGTLNVRKGFRYLGAEVEGNSTMFLANNQQLGADALTLGGRFEQTLHVDVDMQLLPKLTVRGKFDDTLYPAKQELSIEYRGDSLQMTGGDINGGFAGVEFPIDSQKLFGVRTKATIGDHSLIAVAAKMSGASGHYDGRGDNTRGPFFLPDKKVVANSERVYVDGVLKYRGTDYNVDNVTGVINFIQPVDSRFKISVDYEYETVLSLNGETLVVSHYTDDIGQGTAVGLSVGTRRGSDQGEREVFGADGRFSLSRATTLGGEVGVAKTSAGTAEALRAEAEGRIAGVGWNAEVRTVEPKFTGLGNVTPRRDLSDVNVALNYGEIENTKLTTRLTSNHDNVDHDPAHPTNTDLVLESSMTYAVPKVARMEITLGSRGELHHDDLTQHAVDGSVHSYSVGTRYRLDRHMVRASYERRDGDDRAHSLLRQDVTHVANTQVQSRLGAVFATTTLQVSRAIDAGTGKLNNQELLSGMDLSMKLLDHLGTSTSYTLQERTGSADSTTHSAVVSVRGENLRRLSAEASLQLKRTVPVHGSTVENSILAGRAGYRFGDRANLSAEYQRRLTGTTTLGPVSLDLRGNFRPSKEWDLGGGYKIDQLTDPLVTTNSYYGRVAYMEATVNF